MTSPPAKSGSFLHRLRENQGLLAAGGVLAAVAALVGIVAGVLEIRDYLGDESVTPVVRTASASSMAQSAGPPSSAGPTSPSAASPADDVCRTAADQPVDCREPHRYQTLPGNCTLATMIDFMGGDVGREVPFAVVREATGGGCIIDTRDEVEGTAADAFAQPTDDRWRRCVLGDDLVRCDQPHEGEYVATGQAGKADLRECTSAADEYMGRGFDQVSELLKVVVIDEVEAEPESARCVIMVRGAQLMTSSVRALGQNRVPIR